MALQGSGAISFANINTELGVASTTTRALNDAAARTLAGVASGAISMSNFHGKSNTPTFNLTIAANTANYNVKSAAIAAGWSGTVPAIINVTINSGVYVYSTSTGAYAFDTGSSIPSGTTMSLTNNGTILGMGGAGGMGGAPRVGGTEWGNQGILNTPGSAGGPGILAQYAISITNNGTISGGGGGGGGGGCDL